MKYSYKWLQELSGTDKSLQELAALLTMRAFEVEEIETVGFVNDKVVVGEVMTLEKHPDADKLRVARVDVGEEIVQIVCGAPNVLAGQRVAVALEGAVLPGGLEIKKAKLRGVESRGMLCSEQELGTGTDHDGIWVLPGTAKVGMLVQDFLGGGDTLLDIKVLPDRAHDCLSHVGMAREIAALEGRELDFDYEGLQLAFEKWPEGFSVLIDIPDKSKRYIGARVKHVTIGESPLWLQTRLKTLGIRPINTVVDVTNYVMLELGQPLHVFDWDAIAGKKEKSINVRLAVTGEKITLLDDKEYELTTEDIVIADAEQPLALAGIMGGKDSAVTVETKHIFFEAAQFDPVTIRRTRSRLGIRTDASDRFEKGLSARLPERALARALEILGHITSIDAQVSESYPTPELPQEVVCHVGEIESVLGARLDQEQAVQTLRLLGFGTYERDGAWVVQVPEWRLDVYGAADLAEEIGRMVGYEALQAVMPYVGLTAHIKNESRSLKRVLTDTLATLGGTEVYNYSFYSEQDAMSARLPREAHVELENPMNPDQAIMRTSLAPHLFHNMHENLKHEDHCFLFETGRVYVQAADGSVTESARLGGIFGLGEAAEQFFQLKGILGQLFGRMGLSVEWEVTQETQTSLWHPTQTASIVVFQQDAEPITLGKLGMIHPLVRKAFGLRKPGAFFEISLEPLIDLAMITELKKYEPIRKYPTVTRDIALFVPNNVTARQVETSVRSAGRELLIEAKLFDRYVDREEGRLSIAVRLLFGADDRTLESSEVDAVMENIVRTLETSLGGQLRK